MDEQIRALRCLLPDLTIRQRVASDTDGKQAEAADSIKYFDK